MRRALTLLAVGLTLLGCSKSDGPVAGGALEAGDWIVGQPLVHGNLTIFPLLSKAPRLEDRYITLDEGLKAGTVEILEMGAAEPSAAVPDENGEGAANAAAPVDDPFGVAPEQRTVTPAVHQAIADPLAEGPIEEQANRTDGNQTVNGEAPHAAGNRVNSLVVINRSDKPLYLMPGEIIVGGQQDRTIGDEVVIQPDGKPVPIDVFCVEHGRWNNRAPQEYAALLTPSVAADSPARTVAVADNGDETAAVAAEQANSGKFVASVGNVTKETRLAVMYNADQNEVWQKVAEGNGLSGAETQSGAFTANYSQENIVKRLDPYMEKLQQPVADIDRVVGVVVAINGKVESFDAFESTPLFKKLWPKLLKSAALDAANGAGGKDKATACAGEAAQQFVNEAVSVPVHRSETKNGLAVLTRSSERVMGYRAEPATPAAGGMGGRGGAVHAGGAAF